MRPHVATGGLAYGVLQGTWDRTQAALWAVRNDLA